MMFRKQPNFIEIYDKSLSKKECQELIYLFDNSPNTVDGSVRKNGVPTFDSNIKKCKEIEGLQFSKENFVTNIVSKSLDLCIRKYNQKYSVLNSMYFWSVDDYFNFQKYTDETDGYKSWHTEHGPNGYSSRILSWMIYLNNAKSGTEFMYYPSIKAKEGRCVIWPAHFTHFHRSQKNKGLKYLLTGWISFINN